MAFRPGFLHLQEPLPGDGPYVTHPSLRIRDVGDAHKLLEAVRLNILPLIRRRLLVHERAQLRSGNVYVWEECEDVDEGGLVRWTEGRRWSQSRMRGDYLFYEEKIDTTYEEKQAKAARRANKTSSTASIVLLPPPPKRKDRPAKEGGLTKQTYSVTVRLADGTPRKWHVVAYFSATDYAHLPTVDNYDYFRRLKVPDGVFMSSRTPVVALPTRERFPSSISDETESGRGSSRSPGTPSFELAAPGGSFHSSAGAPEYQPPARVQKIDSAEIIRRDPPAFCLRRMKEILYIQAGSSANYLGTHFWNTQESYFTYDDTDAEPEIAHDISFREGLGYSGDPTYCPRLLAFDHRSEFGSLSQANALYGDEDDHEDAISWSENTVSKFAQERITKSQYQTNMEEFEPDGVNAEEMSHMAQLRDVRFWSDFNRVYYVPRTVQKLPDLPEWDDGDGNWGASAERFRRYDEARYGIDGGRVAEHSHVYNQGIQLTHDTSKFGSFINSLLLSLRDEGTKIPVIAVPLLSDAASATPFSLPETRSAWRKTLNDALVLRGLSELTSLSIPLQNPSGWPEKVCVNAEIAATQSHPYHTSAILSSHVESITLPLRLKRSSEDLSTLAGQLTEGGSFPFVELTGAFPLRSFDDDDLSKLDGGIYNFSVSAEAAAKAKETPGTAHFRRIVTRGLSAGAITRYETLLGEGQFSWAAGPAISTHAAAYPLPTSFPAFFHGPRPSSVELITSAAATTKTPVMLGAYARLLENSSFSGIRLDAAQDIGLERDDIAELVGELLELRDRYPAVDEGAEEDDGGSDGDD
ncbi:hypothetical protein MKEN_00982500 [Mycena kentingensis (nom. inval.)]|nr:hypothetical protein MKEN_00982500 [Mycena kentingensis (nom. inval.)]